MRNISSYFAFSCLLAIASPISLTAEELKGKVVDVRGEDVTIQLDAQGFVNEGDLVEVFQEAFGERILEFGTWRVTAVKGDDSLDAKPDEMAFEPKLGLDVVIHATGNGVPNAEQRFSQAVDYLYGSGGVEKNIRKAIELFEKAADMGKASAAWQLGNIHSDENSGRTDYAEAFKWYLEAAHMGNHQAQGRLGRLYTLGKGVRADLVEAERWYRKADASYASSEEYRVDLKVHRMSHPDRPFSPQKSFLLDFAGTLLMLMNEPDVLRELGISPQELIGKHVEILRECARKGEKTAQSQLKMRGLSW